MDERFTVEYIEREANIIIKFFTRRGKKKGQWLFTPFNDMDHRIMKRLGIK
jgi:hypothetical protein